MKRIRFWMHSGYIGSDEEEIVEFPDNVTEDEIEHEVGIWFWENFCGGFGWEEIDEEEEECDD